MAHQRIADFVLNIARADADHSFARGFFLELFDTVLGESGDALAVIELQLLQFADAGFLWLGQARQNRPHCRHFNRMRGDMDSLDPFRPEILPDRS